MRYRLRTLLIVVGAVGVLFGYLRLYVVSSMFLTQGRGSSTAAGGNTVTASVRVYDAAWQANLFKPAATVESIVRGHPVFGGMDEQGIASIQVAMMRFTIRDLLWLMVVVGLSFGWWISLAKARAEWRVERDQIYAQWREERAKENALLMRINTALLSFPMAERQELARTIYGGTDRPATRKDR